jgi:hypothetical protein
MNMFRTALAIIVLASTAAACAPRVIGVSVLENYRVEQEDAITPVRITHRSEQHWNGDVLEQNYNYLLYEFETEQHIYRARAYLDDISTVAVFGPYDKNASSLTPLEGLEIDERVLHYLRRRYSAVTRLEREGYVPIE